MADDWRELIRRYRVLKRLQPEPTSSFTSLRLDLALRRGSPIPDRAQQCCDWLERHGDDPTASDEIKQIHIDDLGREVWELERANPLVRFSRRGDIPRSALAQAQARAQAMPLADPPPQATTTDPPPSPDPQLPATMIDPSPSPIPAEPQQADSLESRPPGESDESTEVPKPSRKPGSRLIWGDQWAYWAARRAKKDLPSEDTFKTEAVGRSNIASDRVTIAPSELRRFMRALYDGDSERPTSTVRKRK